MRRRSLLRAVGALGAAGLAGCTGDGDDGSDGGTGGAENAVLVGPEGALVFDPEEVTVAVGDTVTWEFVDPGHNVSCYPEHHDAVSLPEDAEPFASVPEDDPFATNEEGETYEHTFDEPGTYVYVCVPHAANGMVGTVVVEE